MPPQLLDPAALGINPAQAAQWQQTVQQFVAGRAVEAMLADPRMRAELERVIKEQFQAVNQAGRPVEARPGSKLAEGLATGDLSQLSGQDLLMLLAALLQFADMRRDPGSATTRRWRRAARGAARTAATPSAAAPRAPAATHPATRSAARRPPPDPSPTARPPAPAWPPPRATSPAP